MPTTYQTVNVAQKYIDRDGAEKTRFTRVGTLFFNTTKVGDKPFTTLKLDFPVGATEFVCFPPKERDDDDPVID